MKNVGEKYIKNLPPLAGGAFTGANEKPKSYGLAGNPRIPFEQAAKQTALGRAYLELKSTSAEPGEVAERAKDLLVAVNNGAIPLGHVRYGDVHSFLSSAYVDRKALSSIAMMAQPALQGAAIATSVLQRAYSELPEPFESLFAGAFNTALGIPPLLPLLSVGIVAGMVPYSPRY